MYWVPTISGYCAGDTEIQGEVWGLVEAHRKGTSISYLLLYNKLSQKIPSKYTFIISWSFCGSGIVGWLFLGGFGMSCLVRL